MFNLLPETGSGDPVRSPAGPACRPGPAPPARSALLYGCSMGDMDALPGTLVRKKKKTRRLRTAGPQRRALLCSQARNFPRLLHQRGPAAESVPGTGIAAIAPALKKRGTSREASPKKRSWEHGTPWHRHSAARPCPTRVRDPWNNERAGDPGLSLAERLPAGC